MLDVVAVIRGRDDAVVCERCLVADTMWPRMKGLLGRRVLESGDGMIIRPAPSIHTFFMRFSIDALFLARDGEVLKIASDVAPWRVRSARKAHAVIELGAGEARRRGVSVGDRLSFHPAAG